MAATDVTSDAQPDAWYWCLRHSRVEAGGDTRCPADERLGPYESAEAAQRWKERSNARNQRWDKEDKEWAGD